MARIQVEKIQKVPDLDLAATNLEIESANTEETAVAVAVPDETETDEEIAVMTAVEIVIVIGTDATTRVVIGIGIGEEIKIGKGRRTEIVIIGVIGIDRGHGIIAGDVPDLQETDVLARLMNIIKVDEQIAVTLLLNGELMLSLTDEETEKVEIVEIERNIINTAMSPASSTYYLPTIMYNPNISLILMY